MKISKLYCDGGVVDNNPSPIGGTWAWCATDENDTFLVGAYGTFPIRCLEDVGLSAATNNQMEYYAALEALSCMADGLDVTLHSDSEVTLGRIFKGWACAGIPETWIEQMKRHVARLGTVRGQLLGGHPTQAELKRGYRTANPSPRTPSGRHPVSHHQIWCDEMSKAMRAFARINPDHIVKDHALGDEVKEWLEREAAANAENNG